MQDAELSHPTKRTRPTKPALGLRVLPPTPRGGTSGREATCGAIRVRYCHVSTFFIDHSDRKAILHHSCTSFYVVVLKARDRWCYKVVIFAPLGQDNVERSTRDQNLRFSRATFRPCPCQRISMCGELPITVSLLGLGPDQQRPDPASYSPPAVRNLKSQIVSLSMTLASPAISPYAEAAMAR